MTKAILILAVVVLAITGIANYNSNVTKNEAKAAKGYEVSDGKLTKEFYESRKINSNNVVESKKSHTYYNIKSDAFVGGRFGGKWNKSSFSIKVSKAGNNTYRVSLVGYDNITVKYSHVESGMYVYIPSGSASFDNNTLKKVYSGGKLSDYATGNGNGQIVAFELNGYGLAYLLN